MHDCFMNCNPPDVTLVKKVGRFGYCSNHASEICLTGIWLDEAITFLPRATSPHFVGCDLCDHETENAVRQYWPLGMVKRCPHTLKAKGLVVVSLRIPQQKYLHLLILLSTTLPLEKNQSSHFLLYNVIATLGTPSGYYFHAVFMTCEALFSCGS